MDEFPENINRKNCLETLEKNQLGLIRDCREDFTKSIITALNNCEKSVTLLFNDKLWSEHRVKLTSELLDRFGEVKTVTSQDRIDVFKLTSNIEDIRDNIQKIIIYF